MRCASARAIWRSTASAATLARSRSIGATTPLCVMPMQTIQLLGGSAGRSAFLRAAAAHVRSGGLIACAILGELEPFDCSLSELGPTPERTIVDGLLYESRALRVAESRRHVVIERERRIVRAASGAERRTGYGRQGRRDLARTRHDRARQSRAIDNRARGARRRPDTAAAAADRCDRRARRQCRGGAACLSGAPIWAARRRCESARCIRT